MLLLTPNCVEETIWHTQLANKRVWFSLTPSLGTTGSHASELRSATATAFSPQPLFMSPSSVSHGSGDRISPGSNVVSPAYRRSPSLVSRI
jgi:hypothetical protein